VATVCGSPQEPLGASVSLWELVEAFGSLWEPLGAVLCGLG
jgi:hypothetical protein